MNRRSFLSSLSNAVAGVYFALHVELSVPGPTKDQGITLVSDINPAWENAPYEVGFLYCGYPQPWPKGMGSTIRGVKNRNSHNT